jgi:CRISPR-associated endonuclease/helicase Cas3
MYYAHSTSDKSHTNWQPLPDHLIGTADRAEQFGHRIGLARAARLAGLLHDLGKYTPEFLARLAGAEERVDHSTAGAAIVTRLAFGDDKIIAELIAYAIAGHHAGLPDKMGESFSTLNARLRGFSDGALDPVWMQEIKPCATGLKPDFKWLFNDKARFAFQVSLLARMIFSCLVDADFKDTEQFYVSVERRQVDRDWPSLQSILPDLIAGFDKHMGELRNAVTTVNSLRAEIHDQVRSHAGDSPGLYTLTVPTGGGKTLASLGFALDHAKAHKHERIIYAIPFTAIIDQTAAIFRKVLGKRVVLEHHSAIEDDKYDPKHPPAGKEKLKLAMEDWATPVVVTTNVQFFESLFAARASRSRKLHNIANSVVILDEAQTLPRPLLAPCAQVLDELARNYGCTVVLCTATQPALDARHFDTGHPAALPLVGSELAPDPQALSEELERVTLVHGGEMDDATIVAALASVVILTLVSHGRLY